jgi:outer membrane protein assembly factor BamB
MLTSATVAGTQPPAVAWLKDLKTLGSVSIAPDGDLYFIGSDAKLHRLAPDGKERWNFALGDIGRAQPVVGPGGRVYLTDYDDYVYAISAAGKLDWKAKLDGDIIASPALRADGSLIAAGSRAMRMDG